ncbi:MAG: AI-2E family transporter [Sphingomonadales bacterium]|nr:AI-2E family transporter [Sphingomonadales bacterium]MDE2568561.1 AI-2E family transporter [Sphingomonadales bacterium]
MSTSEESRPRAPGPTDIRDETVRSEAKKAAVWIGMAALFALVVLLAQPLLVIFGGIVFAAMIDGGARLIGRVLPLPRTIRVVIVLLAATAFLVWLVIFGGSQIAAQAGEFPAVVQAQVTRLLDLARAHGVDAAHLDVRGLIDSALGGVGSVTRWIGGVFGGLTTLFLIMILGIYIALEPALYRRGVAWMLPRGERDYFEETAARMSRSLRMLLFGRVLGMAVEGVATGVLLAIYGVPMAALLGLLTGLLAFLPNIGAPISGTLMVLVGFSGGPDMGIYCIIVYLVVQTVDGNVIVPMVAKKTADLAPALVLGMQLIFGVLFGILGLALADPFVAMVKIALERQSNRHHGDEAA